MMPTGASLALLGMQAPLTALGLGMLGMAALLGSPPVTPPAPPALAIDGPDPLLEAMARAREKRDLADLLDLLTLIERME